MSLDDTRHKTQMSLLSFLIHPIQVDLVRHRYIFKMLGRHMSTQEVHNLITSDEVDLDSNIVADLVSKRGKHLIDSYIDELRKAGIDANLLPTIVGCSSTGVQLERGNTSFVEFIRATLIHHFSLQGQGKTLQRIRICKVSWLNLYMIGKRLPRIRTYTRALYERAMDAFAAIRRKNSS